VGKESNQALPGQHLIGVNHPQTQLNAMRIKGRLMHLALQRERWNFRNVWTRKEDEI
jgi:hypothetical protein